MCEWNVKVNPDGSTDEKSLEDNILYAVRRVTTPIRRILWRVQVWNHGPDCKWGNLLAELVGGRSV
jgi:hypothetical protein